MKGFKEELTKHLFSVLNKKLADLETQLKELKQAAENETKSSMGDKYETGRAMVQMEQDKCQRQLSDILKMKQNLQQIIDRKPKEGQVGVGSLVETDQALFYLGIPFGEVQVAGQKVFCISPVSPLGKEFLGLKVSEKAVFSDREYCVKRIL